MSARRIARELAVIVLPQLSKDKKKLEESDISWLITKAVTMLCDYAKQNLSEADSLLSKAANELVDIEVDHPGNSQAIDELSAVNLNTEQLKNQIVSLHRAVSLVAEALDMPAMLLQNSAIELTFECRQCGAENHVHSDKNSKSDVKSFLLRLITTYLEHRSEIDEFIKHAKSKWQVNRMVSIDRDILRLACTEAFFMPDIPISVCINEAVELCHRFADEKAAKFVNGILGDLSREARYFRAKGEFMDRAQEASAEETDDAINDDEEKALIAD